MTVMFSALSVPLNKNHLNNWWDYTDTTTLSQGSHSTRQSGYHKDDYIWLGPWWTGSPGSHSTDYPRCPFCGPLWFSFAISVRTLSNISLCLLESMAEGHYHTSEAFNGLWVHNLPELAKNCISFMRQLVHILYGTIIGLLLALRAWPWSCNNLRTRNSNQNIEYICFCSIALLGYSYFMSKFKTSIKYMYKDTFMNQIKFFWCI